MALKKTDVVSNEAENESLSGKKAKAVFSANAKEKKILTTFSLEPSFKEELEAVFDDLGLGWSAGVRFALKEFYKKYGNN